MRIARGISIANVNKPLSTAPAYDADATAFFTAASITDTTQKSAVNTLVLSLKSANIWTKMLALYPICGGVANSHAVNLKTPGTFNLSFATGWTHSSTGMTPNGATYANSNLIPSTNLTVDSVNISNYSRSQIINQNGVQIGSYDGTREINQSQYYSSLSYKLSSMYRYPNEAVISNNSNTKGFQISTRTASNVLKMFFNGILLNTNTNTRSLTLPIFSIYFGASNWGAGNVSQYSNNELAFLSIGEGLTDAEALSFYNAVQIYQTTLGRQV